MSTVAVVFLLLCFVVWSHSHPVLDTKARTQRKAFPGANKQTAKPPLNDAPTAKEIEHQPNRPETETDGIGETGQNHPSQIHTKYIGTWNQAGPNEGSEEVLEFTVGRDEIQKAPNGRRKVRAEPGGDQIERRGVPVEPDKIQAEPDYVRSGPVARDQIQSCTQKPLPPGQPGAPVWNQREGIATGSVTEPDVESGQHGTHLKPDQILTKSGGGMQLQVELDVMRVQTEPGEMRVQEEPNRNLIEKREVRLEHNKIQADPSKVYQEPESFHHLEPRGHQPQPGGYQNGHYPTTTIQLTMPHPKVLVDAIGRPISRVVNGATQDTVNGICNVSRHKPVVNGRLHFGNAGYLGHQFSGWVRKTVLGKKKPRKPYNHSKYGLGPPQPTPTWFNTHQHPSPQYYPPGGYPPPATAYPAQAPPPAHTRGSGSPR